MTSQLETNIFASRAVSERYMIVRDIVEEVNLRSVKGKSSSYRVNRSITPTFIEETTVSVE